MKPASSAFGIDKVNPDTPSISRLQAIVADEIAKPGPLEVQAIADHASKRHQGAVKAVVFYGSCLREARLDELMVDLYLVVDSYRNAHTNSMEAAFNRMLPPNVYYLEIAFEGRSYRAKYAVIALDQLEIWVRPQTLNPYFWARLSQPFRVLNADTQTQARLAAIGAQSIMTLVSTSPAGEGPFNWVEAYRQTYMSELRSEKPGRSTVILDRNERYFEALDQALAQSTIAKIRCSPFFWWLRRVQGKTLSVLRLIKAAFTFQGGADYLAWKIRRHSGVEIELTDWQRKHPILSAPLILRRLKKQGAVR